MGYGHTGLRSKSSEGQHKVQVKGDPGLTPRVSNGYQTDANKVRASGTLGGKPHRVGDGKNTALPGGKGVFVGR
jgi:hypothetical protein